MLFRDHAMQQPVRHVLAGDTQRGPIFHETHIVDIRYFRATYAMIDPTHYVAKDSLRVVVELSLNFLRRQATDIGQWRRQDVIETGHFALRERFLASAYINCMIVRHVQRRGCG